MPTTYQSTLASVSTHQVPDWYHDAKFGIFIHWSPSCIPAFAPVDKDLPALLKEDGERAMYSHTPYAEWYLNAIKLDGSPAQLHHFERYGEDFNYDRFGEEFNLAITPWQPETWAKLFKDVQAKYVVLVTKHHDGFTLFNSQVKHPYKDQWSSKRDVVGELTTAVREYGLKMGLYYSGSLDWSFYHEPIDDFRALALGGSVESEYIDYVDAQYRELIDKYKPSLLWNDIGYPPKTNLYDLFAYYYNQIPDGLINDRWIQIPAKGRWFFRLGWVKKFISWLIMRQDSTDGIEPPRPPHSDFSTPEYTVKNEISTRKWECVRGIGKSFGYNAEENPEDFLSGEALIHMLIDIVSKNGNLLLNVGPRKDGTIPSEQVDRLRHMGDWLATNSVGIFDTRPWHRASAITECGLEVRFTKKAEHLYLFILGKPITESVIILLEELDCKFMPDNRNRISLLGSNEPVTIDGKHTINVTASWLDSDAQCLEWSFN